MARIFMVNGIRICVSLLCGAFRIITHGFGNWIMRALWDRPNLDGRLNRSIDSRSVRGSLSISFGVALMIDRIKVGSWVAISGITF